MLLLNYQPDAAPILFAHCTLTKHLYYTDGTASALTANLRTDTHTHISPVQFTEREPNNVRLRIAVCSNTVKHCCRSTK